MRSESSTDLVCLDLLTIFLHRREFVDACINYAFNKSVEGVFEAFKKGFFKVCDIDVVEFFQPEELQSVTVGQENYDWEVLKQVRPKKLFPFVSRRVRNEDPGIYCYALILEIGVSFKTKIH